MQLFQWWFCRAKNTSSTTTRTRIGEFALSVQNGRISQHCRFRAHMKLTIKNLSFGDFGNYRCISKNSLGETEGSIRVYGEAREWKLEIIDDIERFRNSAASNSFEASDHRGAEREWVTHEFSIIPTLAWFTSSASQPKHENWNFLASNCPAQFFLPAGKTLMKIIQKAFPRSASM